MYNSRQIQCMQAIGLVPWVRRTAEAVRSPVMPLSPTETKQQSGDQSIVVSGETDSTLLLIFDVRDENAWPLSREDDALLDGMLRSIGMSKATVCSCVILQEAAGLRSGLKALCQAPRKRFLYFGGEAVAADSIDPMPMTQAAPDGVLDGWRLPSLAMLRETPQRKRQAWITLKNLRSALEAAPLDHN